MISLRTRTRKQLLSLLPSVVEIAMIDFFLPLNRKHLKELRFRSMLVIHTTLKILFMLLMENLLTKQLKDS